MTEALFREDAYLTTARSEVARITGQGGVVLAASIFYPTGGGQPGDRGRIVWDDGEMDVVTTKKDGDAIMLIPAEGAARPERGAHVTQQLDWEVRYRCMRIHTALHLLSVVIPLPVTGGQITPQKGRLDFDMPEAPEDRQALEDRLNALIAEDHPVNASWITDAELAARPELVKTMAVRPPTGYGRVRLIRIGPGDQPVDLQPCGGTHVRSTAEIGTVRFGKIEKKGRRNRRVSIHLARD